MYYFPFEIFQKLSLYEVTKNETDTHLSLLQTSEESVRHARYQWSNWNWRAEGLYGSRAMWKGAGDEERNPSVKTDGWVLYQVEPRGSRIFEVLYLRTVVVFQNSYAWEELCLVLVQRFIFNQTGSALRRLTITSSYLRTLAISLSFWFCSESQMEQKEIHLLRLQQRAENHPLQSGCPVN